MIKHNQKQTEQSALCFSLPTVAQLASAAAVGRCARVNLEMKKPHHLRWIMIQTRDWGWGGWGGGGMKQCNWLALSAERARAGAAEYVKNAAEWWGSPAVWGLILMDPVLLSKVPLAPVSDWALWATSAVTETATHPLTLLIFHKRKVCNLKTWWCDVMISLTHTASLH